MGRGPASLVAIGVAALLGSCAEEEDRICRASGPAEVCLVGDPSSYQLEGRGFLPGPEATVTVGEGGRPMVSRVDAQGRVPSGGGVAGVLGGGSPQDVVVSGLAEGGRPVTVELVVPTAS